MDWFPSLLTLPAFEKELSIIKYIARKNEVRIDVDEMIWKKIVKIALSKTTTLVPSHDPKECKLI